jgi:polyphosphate kinase
VRSIVGRFLEHSRIFRFGSGEQATYLIGSADLMQRNLDRRVETLVPVDAPELRSRLDEIIDTLLADDELAWELGVDGDWRRARATANANAQVGLEEAALARSRRLVVAREPT